MASQRPNVILICADQWRGDCLSSAGHPVVRTPFLDSLACEGARFDRAYSACSSCIPARAALYTGLAQAQHGRCGYQDGVPWDYPVTIASEFTRQGYQTQAVGKLHVFPERSQLGFQNVLLHDGYIHFARRNNANQAHIDDYLQWFRNEVGRPDADYADHGIDCNSNIARPWGYEEYLHPTNWVASQSINFLRRRDPRKPFFLYMSFQRPHTPYDPPAWAFEQYLHAQMPPPPQGAWSKPLQVFDNAGKPQTFVGKFPPDVLQRARAGYFGHMSHIDQQIFRFIESLHECRVGPTYVAFVSDHGEMLGDHNLWRKGLPYEGSAHIPFLLYGPKDSGIRGNSVVSDLVELRDVMPTLLECAGLVPPAGLDGHSVLPLARGEQTLWRSHLHGEHLMFGQSVHYIVELRYKYVWFSGSGQEQLFDLTNDPHEVFDLAAQNNGVPPVMQHLRELLIEELQLRPEGFVANNKLQKGQPVKATLSSVLNAFRSA
ncbi:MAG: arylsulfatase [Phycisphaerae bacterium]